MEEKPAENYRQSLSPKIANCWQSLEQPKHQCCLVQPSKTSSHISAVPSDIQELLLLYYNVITACRRQFRVEGQDCQRYWTHATNLSSWSPHRVNAVIISHAAAADSHYNKYQTTASYHSHIQTLPHVSEGHVSAMGVGAFDSDNPFCTRLCKLKIKASPSTQCAAVL